MQQVSNCHGDLLELLVVEADRAVSEGDSNENLGLQLPDSVVARHE